MKKLFFSLLLSMTSFISFAQEATPISTNNFIGFLLNGMDMYQFLALLIWGLIGVIGNLVSDVIRRNKKSPTSPEKFSMEYYLSDNKWRIILSFILLPLVLISTNEILSSTVISPLGSFFIGLSSDHFIEILKRKNIITSAFNRFGKGEESEIEKD